MRKSYLVTGTWVDKETNKPKSNIAEITSGVNEKGKHYAIADTKKREIIDEGHPIGAVLEFTMTRVPQVKDGKATSETPNIKINS